MELSLELDYDSWVRMETEHWFGMSPDSIDPSVRGYSLHPRRPVRVSLRLQQPADDLLPSGLNAEAAAAAVAAELRQESSALLQENLWLWLDVLQTRADLPSNVLEGFFSVYHD